MPLYTFKILCHRTADCESHCVDLPDDAAARCYGKGVLAAHPSAVTISLVRGELHVGFLRRPRSASDAEQLRSARACIAASLELLRQTASAPGIQFPVRPAT